MTYGSLARVLEQFGYEKRIAKGTHVVFVDKQGKPRVFLPWRPASAKVDPARLAGVYLLVSSGGGASAKAIRGAFGLKGNALSDRGTGAAPAKSGDKRGRARSLHSRTAKSGG